LGKHKIFSGKKILFLYLSVRVVIPVQQPLRVLDLSGVKPRLVAREIAAGPILLPMML
jgi:hypothetical protein